MKRVFLLLLLAMTSQAYNITRENTHTITPELQDHYFFKETFYQGSEEWFAYKVLGKEFVQSRAPNITISSWSINRDNTQLIITAAGEYSDYVQELDDTYKIGGRGFIDKICEQPYGFKEPVIQMVKSTTVLPEGYEIVSFPKNYSITTQNLGLEYNVTIDKDLVVETVTFKVRDMISTSEYCEERKSIAEPIEQGVMISTSESFDTNSYLEGGITSAVVMLLLYEIAFILRELRK